MVLNKIGFIKKIKESIWQIQKANKPKIFGIGNNKTGTTSLKSAMQALNYKVGNQRQAEIMHHTWAKRDFQPIVEYCKTAEFFQDFPFSKPFTFIALDQAYPNSKFILTVRSSPEEWYNSLIKFHAKLWGKNGRVPTKEDLKEATYIYKGWAWEVNRYNYNSPENDPYNKEALIKNYLCYNQQVKEYFKHRKNDLLVLNVAQPNAYQELCKFLGKEIIQSNFPWTNKTADLDYRN